MKTSEIPKVSDFYREKANDEISDFTKELLTEFAKIIAAHVLEKAAENEEVVLYNGKYEVDEFSILTSFDIDNIK